jgi:hypothetical protein
MPSGRPDAIKWISRSRLPNRRRRRHLIVFLSATVSKETKVTKTIAKPAQRRLVSLVHISSIVVVAGNIRSSSGVAAVRQSRYAVLSFPNRPTRPVECSRLISPVCRVGDSCCCSAPAGPCPCTPTPSTMSLDLSSITLYELVSFTQRRIDAFASLFRSLDESLTKEQRDAAGKEICRYPRSDSGADYGTLQALEAHGRVHNHVLIAQHVLAVLSVNSPSMRTTLLHCERVWAQAHDGASVDAVVALYGSLWHRYRAIDVFNAPEPRLVTAADILCGNWQTMTAHIRAKITYGLNQHNNDGVVLESRVGGAPLSRLAYQVRLGFGANICRTLEVLQNAVGSVYTMASEDPDELDERALICDELGCWVVELPPEASAEAPHLVVMFPSIVVAGDDWALPTLAELREMLDDEVEKDQLWAVPLDSVAWGFYRDTCNHYFFNGGPLKRHPQVTLSLRPSREQWRRFSISTSAHRQPRISRQHFAHRCARPPPAHDR